MKKTILVVLAMVMASQSAYSSSGEASNLGARFEQIQTLSEQFGQVSSKEDQLAMVDAIGKSMERLSLDEQIELGKSLRDKLDLVLSDVNIQYQTEGIASWMVGPLTAFILFATAGGPRKTSKPLVVSSAVVAVASALGIVHTYTVGERKEKLSEIREVLNMKIENLEAQKAALQL